LIDIGGVMALCLMYLTDAEAGVQQATNACLTRVLRLQTQLANGTDLNEQPSSTRCISALFPGASENGGSAPKAVEKEQSANDDTIQVSTS
jgi:hypothetical protein